MSTAPHVDAHHDRDHESRHILGGSDAIDSGLDARALNLANQGELIFRSAAANTIGVLAVGVAGQVLYSGGPAADIYWGDALSFTRDQDGSQATTNALAVVGVAIEDATDPFIVESFISLHNMQAGDTFLVIEEVRDEDDVTYREYDRNSYSGVQESPMVRFLAKMCQGWRLRIQRTAGADRIVTYQYFLMEAG